MRKEAALVLAALFLLVPRAGAASAEPELTPMTPLPRATRTEPQKAPAPIRRVEKAKPKPAPLEKDEVRTKLREGPPKREFVTFRSRAW